MDEECLSHIVRAGLAISNLEAICTDGVCANEVVATRDKVGKQKVDGGASRCVSRHSNVIQARLVFRQIVIGLAP